MKRTFSLLLALLLSFSACVAGLAEGQPEPQDQPELHLFLDIPFGVSVEDCAERIREETGLVGEYNTVRQYNVKGIPYLGYALDLQADPNTERITFTNGHLIAKPEVFQEQFEQDVHQFVDMERSLTALYGEPDKRYFYIEGNIPPTPLMFPSGTWDAEEMIAVQEAEGRLYAFSVWNNVLLELRAFSQRLMYGGFMTGIHLYYYDKPAVDGYALNFSGTSPDIVPYEPGSGE